MLHKMSWAILFWLGFSLPSQALDGAYVVRVNAWACLEALVNIFANGAELVGILLGLVTLVNCYLRRKTLAPAAFKRKLISAPLWMIAALCFPGAVNYLWLILRDYNVIS